jgi:deazaflavin-dependent oxidoreductase (nitroreductase family)
VAGDHFWKALNTTHRTLLRLPGGKRFWRRGGMPVVELTTTGRRSKQPRTVLLTAPVEQRDGFVLVASRAGAPQHPAWFLNLCADPNVEVRTSEGRWPMVARVATPAERADLWPQVTLAYPGYGIYQEKADREIPLVLVSSE